MTLRLATAAEYSQGAGRLSRHLQAASRLMTHRPEWCVGKHNAPYIFLFGIPESTTGQDGIGLFEQGCLAGFGRLLESEG
jgi:hypothetical protein